MKRRCGFVVAAALVACALKPHPVEARGPSTQEERAQFVALVRSLERDPLAENASATRQHLREWMIEVPDITFKVCDDLLGQTLGDKYAYSSELSLQAVLSGAVLTMERPGEARNDIAVYTAGIEGALRAYEVLVRSRADARLAALDDLLEAQRRGELVDHVSVLAKQKCKRTNTLHRRTNRSRGGSGVSPTRHLLVWRRGQTCPDNGGCRSGKRQHHECGHLSKHRALLRGVLLDRRHSTPLP